MLTRYLLDCATWAMAGLLAGLLIRPWLDGRVMSSRDRITPRGRR